MAPCTAHHAQVQRLLDTTRAHAELDTTCAHAPTYDGHSKYASSLGEIDPGAFELESPAFGLELPRSFDLELPPLQPLQPLQPLHGRA